MKGKAQRLHYCERCKELSVVRRVYMRKSDNRMERIEYCLNRCGYKQMLPFRVLTAQEVANV